MKTRETYPGKTYSVTSPNGCTVTTEDGKLILTVKAGVQDYFVAPAGKVIVSDDAASVTENFRGMHTVALAAEAGANAAMRRAETAADSAQEDAALIGDAALKGADNVFSGVNSFVGGLLVENNLPLLWMLAGAYRFPLAAALAETEDEYILRAPKAMKDEDWFMFAPRVPVLTQETYIAGGNCNGRCFAIVPNLKNPCFAKEINAVVFGEELTCVVNPYRCNVLSLFYSGKKARYLLYWGHNSFTQAPDIVIDAPYLTGFTYELVTSLRTVGSFRLRMPSLKRNFALKIGAIKREDVLYLLENLPDLKGEKKCTAALSCDPALEGDEDFLAAVAAFYDAETGTGWDVGLTFQQNEKFNDEAAAAATYGLRRPRAVPVYAKRVPSEGGAWVDAAGARWDLMTAHWVADESDWRLFADDAAAIEEWGLTACPMEDLTETE